MEYVPVGGIDVPSIGVGTWQMDTAIARDAVSDALDVGYRHVDTAQAYDNERGVGAAIDDAAVAREDVFLTTKVDPSHRTVQDIVEAVESSLEALGTEYVDLLLIHWPHPLANLETVMAGLNEAVERGMARQLGVSNFGIDRLDRARELSAAPVLTDQVLCHPWWPQRELLSYCQDNDVMLTAYSPLANGGLLGDDVLAAIGERYGKTRPR